MKSLLAFVAPFIAVALLGWCSASYGESLNSTPGRLSVEKIEASGSCSSTEYLRCDGTWTAPPGGAGISDGDKGDITVGSSGASWTIDSGAFDFSELSGTATDAQIPNNITVDNATAAGTATTAATASAGDSATGFFPSGTLEDALVSGAAESDEITGLTDAQISDTLTCSTSTTASANDNDTSIATTAFVQQEIDDGDLLSDNCTLENDSTPIPDSCVGDGTDGGGGGVSDGDKGDITVSGSGATWTVDASAVAFSELSGTATDAQIPDTITASSYQPLDSDLTTIAGLSCSNGNVARVASGAWSCGTGVPIRQYMTSTVSTTSASVYSALSAFDYTITNGVKLIVNCRLFQTAAAGTTGPQIQVTGVASATAVTITRRYYNNSSAAPTNISQTAFNSTSTDDGAAGSCGTNRCITDIDIYIDPLATGSLDFALVSEVDTSNVSILAGSWCEYVNP